MTPARSNPFRVDQIESRLRFDPKLVGWSWGDCQRRLRALDHRAAIVGPHGSGKTSFLEALVDQLRGDGFLPVLLFLNADTAEKKANALLAMAPEMDARHVLLLDGAEQLPWREWRRLLRSTRPAGGLIVTAHRRPRLPALFHLRPTPALLAPMIERLGEDPARYQARANAAFKRHDGNVRATLRELYDAAE